MNLKAFLVLIFSAFISSQIVSQNIDTLTLIGNRNIPSTPFISNYGGIDELISEPKIKEYYVNKNNEGWQIQNYTYYEYTTINLDRTIIVKDFDSTKQLKGSYRFEYKYDDTNRLISLTVFNQENDRELLRKVVEYDDSTIYADFYKHGNIEDKYIFELNPDGSIASFKLMKDDLGRNNWTVRKSEIYHYGSDGKMDFYISSGRMNYVQYVEGEILINENKDDKTFLSFGENGLISKESYAWNRLVDSDLLEVLYKYNDDGSLAEILRVESLNGIMVNSYKQMFIY